MITDEAMFPPWLVAGDDWMLMLGMMVDVMMTRMVLVFEYQAYHVRSFLKYENQNVNVALIQMNRMDHYAWIHENQNQMIRCSSVHDVVLVNLLYV